MSISLCSDGHTLLTLSSIRLISLGRSGHTCKRVRVNAALAEGYPEEAAQTPGRAPGVGDDPVLEGALNSPTNDLHCMTAHYSSALVDVDAALVTHEVTVDGEAGLHRTVSQYLLLNGSRGFEFVGFYGLVESRALRGAISTFVVVTGTVGVTGVQRYSGTHQISPGLR